MSWRSRVTHAGRKALLPIVAVAAGLALAVALLALMGLPPGPVVQGLLLRSVLNDSGYLDAGRIAITLQRACPIILCGLAVCVALRSGILNIGAEGQYVVGCAAFAATAVPLGAWHAASLGWTQTALAALALPLALTAAAMAGAAWAGIAAGLRSWARVPEVLSTILLNVVAIKLVTFLVLSPLRDPNPSGGATSAYFPAIARLPTLALGSADTGALAVHAGVLVALALPVLASVLTHHTVVGFAMTAVGQGERAARFMGLRAQRLQLGAFALSGALAGLAGALHHSGAELLLRKEPGADYGFLGIAVALLARLEPAGVIAAGLLFAMLDVGAQNLQRSMTGFPYQAVFVVQAIIVLAVALGRRR